MSGSYKHLCCTLTVLLSVAAAGAQSVSDPENWIVLYNLNDADSADWAAVYLSIHEIPQENLLGLDASTSEKLSTLAEAEAQIVVPIQNYLAANPEVAARACGIVLGYRLPGIYGNSPYGGPGGLSVANLLHDLSSSAKQTNPHNAGFAQELPPPLTKSILGPNRFAVGWMDAPTFNAAVALSLQASILSSPQYCLPESDVAYFDYNDSILLPTWWRWLEFVTPGGRDGADFAEIPWVQFDADVDSTPNDAFRFGTHDIDGWGDGRLFAAPYGSRILAYNLNSWGATTVRSTTAGGGRYVPNAIDAGYAAAIGSTGEPGNLISPYPWVLLASLRDGRTLGEAMYLANPNDNWTWACVGDPLLKIANWFGQTCIELSSGDLNCDGFIDSFDIEPFISALSNRNGYEQIYADCDWRTGDINGDGQLNSADISGFIDLLLYR